ncbi:hypothetical protein [Microbacterium bovistercoris]|nr:hypothetical protein [Microbacterium bovistercoris]
MHGDRARILAGISLLAAIPASCLPRYRPGEIPAPDEHEEPKSA